MELPSLFLPKKWNEESKQFCNDICLPPREAAAEYAEDVAFYESLHTGLGMRFHEAVKTVITSACEMPASYRTEYPADIQ